MKILTLLGLLALLCMGCATTRTVESGKISAGSIPEIPETSEYSESETSQTAQSHLQLHVSLPDAPDAPDAPVYDIQSGKSGSVWVDGIGLFRGSLDEIYADLTDVQIMGPTHLTKDIVRDQFTQTPERTSYVMHVKMRYILSVEFDLTVTIEPLFDGDTQTGWLYRSEKTSGTRFIQRISDTIRIERHGDNWFLVELQSLNEASQDKEDEARAHVESLFKHWESR